MAKLLTHCFQSTGTYILSYREIKVVGFYFKNSELIKTWNMFGHEGGLK